MAPKKTIRNLLALGFFLCPAVAFAYSGEVYRVCGLNPDGDNYLSLRSCAGTSCTELNRLASGTFMWTMEPVTGEGWSKVVPMHSVADMFTDDPEVGFVYNRYICKVD